MVRAPVLIFMIATPPSGSPVLVAGAVGWVSGAGAGHNPQARRQASGHALSPGASCAVNVEVHGLERRWIRACHQRQEGSALLVALAAPVPLLDLDVARQAACGNEHLQAPVLDYGIPRRVRPNGPPKPRCACVSHTPNKRWAWTCTNGGWTTAAGAF